MGDVGIEYQTVLGCPPVEFVHLAADLGCHAISMKPRTGSHNPYNPYGYGDFSFPDNPGLRRQMAAAERGMQTTLEFSKSLALSDLETALAAVRHVGRSDFRLLIDTMHLVRSGSTATDLAAVDPALVGYVQLSDAALEQRNAVYRDDSSDRSVPGEGELPLADIMSVLPEWLPVGVEAPMRSRAAQGTPVRECARLAVEGARAVLAEARSKRKNLGENRA